MVKPAHIKICCIASTEEAELAVAAGASAVGLVSAMPSGPGPIADEQIAAIARGVPPPIATFLLTCRQDALQVAPQVRASGCNTVQLCDAFTDRDYATLRRELPNVRLVQVIHVEGEASIDEALGVAPLVDALLLDSVRPKGAVKELGGTGRVHDWAVSRVIRQRSPVPLLLAGALNAGNVGEAIRAVRPFGVDVCSGVRTDGKLDPGKLSRFVRAVQDAAARP
ncbi:MAG TPA: phosphoribosylanthranilate isomerase [Tepidisphaeraceae bacterium]|nr:phosphoribosylanthranilate isomerase [Tepidisphaeraceae bacterium]